MTLPDSAEAGAPLPMDRKAKSAARVIVKVLYSVTFLPVAMWCLFWVWAIAKNMRDTSMGRGDSELWPMIANSLPALVIPLLWTAGVAGSAILARRGRRWLLWAMIFLVLVVVALVAVIIPFVVYFASYRPMP
ncbi:hypothetical protein [Agromyces albus]|uniref:Uncharacterized protein n=1 Tax=Agromyces albus TaxID=205332 RepID=A0A4Q2KPG9_9MICO|nr:hypothetical protein [Agromyces albus]RXZ67265.1 hypothetical protein ESP51_18505 [Agromyces albus]